MSGRLVFIFCPTATFEFEDARVNVEPLILPVWVVIGVSLYDGILADVPENVLLSLVKFPVNDLSPVIVWVEFVSTKLLPPEVVND